MEFYLSANNPLKGKKILFKYPNLMTVEKLQNNTRLKGFLETRELFNPVKIQKKNYNSKKLKNFKFFEEIYGIDYKEKLELFLESNFILKRILEENIELSVEEIQKMYYEETELFGTIEKKNCLNISNNYFISLIHKINKPGFFRFDIENKIIFGFKKDILEKKIKVISFFNEAEQNEEIEKENEKINFFFIFIILDRSKEELIFQYKQILCFIEKILYRLEINFSFLSTNYSSNTNENTFLFFPEEIYLEKEKRMIIIKNIFNRYLMKTKNEVLINLLTQLFISIISQTEIKIKNLKINFREFNQFSQNLLESKPKLDKNTFFDFYNKTLLFFNKKKTLAKIENNKILEKIVKEISPFASFGDIMKRLDINKNELKFYIKHLLFWNECKLISPVFNDSILMPNYNNKMFYDILEHKKKDFFHIFKKSITDIIFFFLQKKSISYFDFKKHFLTENLSSRNILIFLMSSQLVITKDVPIRKKTNFILKNHFNSQKFVDF